MTNSGKRIKFTPRWPGAIEGHAVNAVRKWFPALCAEHEFDDLLQEAWVVFHRCKERYPNIDNPKWFMAVFRTSLQNRLMNMAARCGRMISLDASPSLPVEEPSVAPIEERGPGLLGLNEIVARVLREVPEEARGFVLAIFFGPEAEGREAYRKLRVFLPPF